MTEAVQEPEFTTRSIEPSLLQALSLAFLEIVVPMVSTGIISSALFAFAISLNEFVMALFLTDRDTQTLPVLMWLSLRSAGTPRLAVASVILAGAVFACLTLIVLWYVRVLRRTMR